MDIGDKFSLRVLIFDLLDGLLKPMHTLSKVGKNSFASSSKNLLTPKRSYAYAETLLLALGLSACQTTHYWQILPVRSCAVTETVATSVSPPRFYATCADGRVVSGSVHC